MGPAFRLLQTYLARQGLSPLVEGEANRVIIHVDDRYDVQVSTLRQTCVVLRSRLADLPAPGVERDALVMGAAHWMQTLLPEHAAACVVNVRDESLWLQQTVVAAATVEGLELAMASFVNALAFWHATHDLATVIR